MSHDPWAEFDQHVLEQIERSPVGAVPRTPAFQDALRRLTAAQQIYASADHRDGFVTARSLAGRPVFHAANLAEFRSGALTDTQLEPNAKIFDRYVASLPASLHASAEPWRARVLGKTIRHRPRGDGTVVHDPLHTLFLVPGGGIHPGLPGNYLFGFVAEHGGADPATAWGVDIHDRDDGAMLFDVPNLGAALEKLDEVLASAPFHLSELAALGFRSN